MSYRIPFPGATGGYTDPGLHPQLVGARHANAGGEYRSAGFLAPGLGLAASHPSAALGVGATDKSHNSVLDGHRGSVVANHPDGQFARNTAATSDHSLHANSEMLAPALTGYTMDARTLELDIDTGPSALRPSVPSSRLEQNRADRLYDQPELVVKRATATGTRTGSLLFREYTPEELAVGAVMLYAAYSAVA